MAQDTQDCNERNYSASDYNAKLAKDYEDIRDRVERGMLPLVARIPAIDDAVTTYVAAQDARKGGRNGE